MGGAVSQASSTAKRRLLCVHQGYELYGSDRSLLQTLKAVRDFSAACNIALRIPRHGPLVQYAHGLVDELIVEERGTLRKRDFLRLDLRKLLAIPRGVGVSIKEARKYDAVYLNSVVLIADLIAARFSGTRTLVHVREIPVGAPRWLLARLLRFSRARCIFNSQATRDAFREIDESHSVVVPNGVPGFKDVPALHELAERPLRLLVIGRLNDWKGQPLVLSALGQLTQHERSQIRIRIVGDVFEDQHHFRERLQQQCGSLGLTSCVEFFGFTNEPEEHYRWADVVVVPSLKPEPFGLVAVEAMSAGRAVIAANHGGLKEIVAEGKTGLLFEPGAVGALTVALRQLLENRTLCAELGASGRERFAEHYAAETYRSRMAKLINEGLGGGES